MNKAFITRRVSYKTCARSLVDWPFKKQSVLEPSFTHDAQRLSAKRASKQDTHNDAALFVRPSAARRRRRTAKSQRRRQAKASSFDAPDSVAAAYDLQLSRLSSVPPISSDVHFGVAMLLQPCVTGLRRSKTGPPYSPLFAASKKKKEQAEHLPQLTTQAEYASPASDAEGGGRFCLRSLVIGRSSLV